MHKKKLIEVAIPLDAINRASIREKSLRHGHPSTIHLWWERRPLAACRAVLFASLVDDPSAHPERFPTEQAQVHERDRLFAIIEELVKWENSSNQALLAQVRAEIAASCDGDLPVVVDPFAGGGSIPLEAQRLGLRAVASDLNPVAVTINKALIEVPPAFAGMAPVNPEGAAELGLQVWDGAQGLARDVTYYGRWVREEAYRRVGHLYPKVSLPASSGGGDATPIAWIWARTVRSPNPAWAGMVPLAKSFVLVAKKGSETWIEPVVDHQGMSISYQVRSGPGSPPQPTILGRQGGRCIATDSAIPFSYIRDEASSGRMSADLMAIVCEGPTGKVYVSPTPEQVAVARQAQPDWRPTGELLGKSRVNVGLYGVETWADLFTPRQLVSLGTFSALISEVASVVKDDALRAGLSEGEPLRSGGTGAKAYAEAVCLYLGLAVGRMADRHSSVAGWDPNPSGFAPKIRNTFARQAIPMVWDYAEGNPFSEGSGNLEDAVGWVVKVLERSITDVPGKVEQRDARSLGLDRVVVSTDPPYYDNIAYADLSDYFYVWLRRAIGWILPDEFSTLQVPKVQELVATPYRFDGDRKAAESFFEKGLEDVFRRVAACHDERFPFTVYYAFKQSETREAGVASTGWETMLQSLIQAGFVIEGTWPLRSELSNRMIASGANALASSIVLACRRRSSASPMVSRREFIDELKATLPDAVRTLQHGSIAPVDMAQASIGPGMAVFSAYARVVEADGSAMRVRTALELINQVLDETVAGTDADFDSDTRWAVTWFEDCGMNEGDFGRAEQLSKSRNTSVPGLSEAGIVTQRPGKVRLTARDELSTGWDPRLDERLTVWEITQHLIRRLENDGEAAAAVLLRQVGSDLGETAKELAYRLYLVCERKGWAKEAISYNALVAAWPELTRLAASDQAADESDGQGQLL